MINKELISDYPERVNILNVPISVVNMQSCINFLLKNWESAKGNYICVSNVHTTVMAHENEDYRLIQSNSLLSVPDGKPLSVIAKKKHPSISRVTGPQLMREFLELSRDREIRHFFYGTTQENLDSLVKEVKRLYPWVKIVGTEASVFRELTSSEENELIGKINASSADIVWVSLGAPRQEFFCAKNEGKINSLMIGVGGAFSVIAGIIPEAPKWMQNTGLEWLFRLIKEPRRLYKRYLITNSKFIYYFLKNNI